MVRPIKIKHFRLWVFWTGVFNIVAYGALVCPFTLKNFFNITNGLNNVLGLGGSLAALPINVANLMMINLLGIIAVFLGIFLIVASLDIERRAWFVFWQGLGRIIVFSVILYFVLFKNPVRIVIGFGIIELIIGIIYMYYIFTIEELKIS